VEPAFQIARTGHLYAQLNNKPILFGRFLQLHILATPVRPRNRFYPVLLNTAVSK